MLRDCFTLRAPYRFAAERIAAAKSPCRCLRPRSALLCRGFTLVELLVVIGIMGTVVSLLIPALFSARESARRRACENNLRQCGFAILTHLQTHRHFPTGGWGKKWVGLPDRGYRQNQPGGWVYNILAYVDQQQLRGAGKGAPANHPDPGANARRVQTANPLFHCPTRRRANLYHQTEHFEPYFCDKVSAVARTDYAMNGGHRLIRSLPFPQTLPVAAGFVWPDMSQNTGLTHMRSTVRLEQVADGQSYTYLLAEKYVPVEHYTSGQYKGDDESMYTGNNRDITRFTGEEDDRSFAPRPDSALLPAGPPHHPVVMGLIFGSAHGGGFNAVFCDNATRHIRYEVSQVVHSRLGRRNDSRPVELPR